MIKDKIIAYLWLDQKLTVTLSYNWIDWPGWDNALWGDFGWGVEGWDD